MVNGMYDVYAPSGLVSALYIMVCGFSQWAVCLTSLRQLFGVHHKLDFY